MKTHLIKAHLIRSTPDISPRQATFESTPGSANKALVDEIQKKLEAAQVSYEAVRQAGAPFPRS